MSNKAKVGDLIQYRYVVDVFPRYTTRRVEQVVTNEQHEIVGYSVEGGYFVEKKDVMSVMPLHGGESQGSSPKSQEFPLEAGQ